MALSDDILRGNEKMKRWRDGEMEKERRESSLVAKDTMNLLREGEEMGWNLLRVRREERN